MSKKGRIIFITDPHMSSTTPSSRIDNYPVSMFRKMEFVLQKCKEYDCPLLCGGDWFNTPTQIDWIKNTLTGLIKRYGVDVYWVVGNHDLLYYDVSTMDKTSVGGLRYVTTYLNDMTGGYVEYRGWKIYGHDFLDPELPDVDTENSIILSHTAIEAKYEKDKLYIHKDKIKKSKAAFACFGHDHNQYPVKDLGGTQVVRPGALSRGSSHTENEARQISYAVIDLDTRSYWYEPVTIVNRFDDVFNRNYEVKREKTIVSFDEIQKFIDDFKASKSTLNPYDILLAMKPSEEVYESCSYYMNKAGLVPQE